MSSSSEADGTVLVPLAIPELRTGLWTRFGSSNVLGDSVTEATLATLAESTRIAAGSQGYSVGWAEGQRAAREAARVEAATIARTHQQDEERRDAEHADAVAALQLAAVRLHDAVADICATIEDQASELAYELTRALVGHEVGGPGIDVVRRVLALVPTEPIARVRLHPADAAGAAAFATQGIVVVADLSLNRGDALVEADDHVLDLRVDTALERVRAALLDRPDA